MTRVEGRGVQVDFAQSCNQDHMLSFTSHCVPVLMLQQNVVEFHMHAAETTFPQLPAPRPSQAATSPHPASVSRRQA